MYVPITIQMYPPIQTVKIMSSDTCSVDKKYEGGGNHQVYFSQPVFDIPMLIRQSFINYS